MKNARLLVFIAAFLLLALPAAAETESFPVENSDLTLVVDTLDEEGNYNYSFVDQEGKELLSVPVKLVWTPEDSDEVYAVDGYASDPIMSPGGKYVAVRFGMECGLNWLFIDMEQGRQVGGLKDASYEPLYWADDDTAVFDFAVDMYESRQCEAQCCPGYSAGVYSPAKDEAQVLAEVTPECDYMVTGLEDGAVQVDKICASLRDWQTLASEETATRESITIPLK